jgi:ATP-dependent DNA helicase RecG
MKSKENENVELKQSLAEWREIVETAAAFATAAGGTVPVGVTPRGERAGVKIGKGSLEDLANKIKLNTDPPLFSSLTVEGREDAAMVTIRVEESPIKPVWAFGRPLKRVGRTNQHLTRHEAQRLTELSTGRTWDALPCPRLGLTNIDQRAVADFLRRAGLRTVPFKTLARNLSLLSSEARFCNAVALLFANNPQEFFPQAQLKCARFAGTTSVKFIDESTFEGNVLSQLDNAQKFIARNTHQEIRITGRPERDIVPEYPVEAVREALVNAVCHRDYAAVGTVQVRIYDDRLEVWNPGTLPADLTIAQLYREHPSRPHNPRLAHVLYRARLIEQWGSGTLRMMGICDNAGASVAFRMEAGFFVARFAANQVKDAGSEGDTRKTTEKTTEKILVALQEDPGMSATELAEKLGISYHTIDWYFRKLKKTQRIRHVGPDKGGHWEVVK